MFPSLNALFPSFAEVSVAVLRIIRSGELILVRIRVSPTSVIVSWELLSRMRWKGIERVLFTHGLPVDLVIALESGKSATWSALVTVC